MSGFLKIKYAGCLSNSVQMMQSLEEMPPLILHTGLSTKYSQTCVQLELLESLMVLSSMEKIIPVYHVGLGLERTGLEEFKYIYSLCTRVLHCINYVRSYLHEVG